MAACTDSHRQHVRGFVHKSPGRHSFQGFVQAGSEFTAMGGLSPSLHQSNAHPRSPESWGGHAFKEENPSRGMEVAPWVGSDDLEPLRESGGGSIRYERECTLPVVLLPVPIPAERGRAHSALASSQALWVSSDQNISKQRLSHWIVDAITAAYTSQGLECPLHIRAHSRGVERYVYSGYMRCSRLVFSEYFRQVLQAGRSVRCLPSAVGEWLIHVFFATSSCVCCCLAQ